MVSSNILGNGGIKLFPNLKKLDSVIQRTDNNFCVISGKEYCLKVIALHHSLQRHCQIFNLWICCMDSFTFMLMKKLNLKNVHLLQVEVIEDDNLRKVKKDRKLNEYCWTIKAPLVEYLLTTYDIEKMIYCDGDLYFFSDPVPILNEWGERSVFLCPQRDLDWVEQKYGRFQAGLIGFKKDQYGMESLKWWKSRCLEWCSHEEKNGQYGDQKYLDNFPLFFQKVKISGHLGIDAAPWNIIYNNNYKITKNDQSILIEDDPLVVFHFACLTIYDNEKFDLWSLGKLKIQSTIINEIYVPYLDEIRSVMKEINAVEPDGLSNCLSKQPYTEANTFYHYSPLRREMDQSDEYYNFAIILSKDFLIKGLTLYYSLKKKINNFHMWICCMDHVSFEKVKQLNLTNISILQVEEVEDEELLKVKNERTLQEYCWTMKAPLCQHILNNYGEVDHIIYCDSDLYFFSDPKPILEQWNQYSIFLCKQRGSQELERIHGQYQAGLIGFKKEENSMKILNWWREKCIERCSSIYDKKYGTWGDQKYLDAIPHLFSNIKISDDPGINAAPWNLVMMNNSSVSKKKKTVIVDDSDLIVYHFGSMLMINKKNFDLWKLEPLSFDSSIIENIYLPYILQLRKTCRKLKKKTNLKNLTPFFASIPDDYQSKNPFFI